MRQTNCLLKISPLKDLQQKSVGKSRKQLSGFRCLSATTPAGTYHFLTIQNTYFLRGLAEPWFHIYKRSKLPVVRSIFFFLHDVWWLCDIMILHWRMPSTCYSQPSTNLKTADTFSMRTLCRMTKIESTSPVTTSRATGHNHQLETARGNTSNQAHLANYQEWRKRTIKHLKCILQNYHIPLKIYAHSGSVRRTLYCPFPQTFGGPSRQERRSRGVSARALSSGAVVTSSVWFCFEQVSDQHQHLAAMLEKRRHLTQEQSG